MKKHIAVIVTALSLAATVSVASAVEVESIGVDIHGFASQGYLIGTKQNNYISSSSGKGSFNFNEFGVNFGKQLLPDLRIGLQLFAQDRGAYGKDKITLDWAFADYRFKDWLGFRAGKIKNPYGFYGDTRDTDSLRAFVLLPQPVYSDSMRDSSIALYGGGIYGAIPLGPAGRFAYQAQVGTTILDIEDGTSVRAASSLQSKLATMGVASTKMTEMNGKVTSAFSAEWSPPLPGLRLITTGIFASIEGKAQYLDAAGTAAKYPNVPAMFGPLAGKPLPADVSFKNFQVFTYGVEQTIGDLVLAAEYNTQGYEQTALGKSSWKVFENWYVSATYQLTDWLQTGVYYTERHDRGDWDGKKYAAANTGFPAHNAYAKDLALALKLDPMKYVTLKLEGHMIEGTALLDASEYKTANKDSYLFATKVTVSF